MGGTIGLVPNFHIFFLQQLCVSYENLQVFGRPFQKQVDWMLAMSSDVWIPWRFFVGDGSKNGVTKKKEED